MTDGMDWLEWHADYRDESWPLSRRLRIVQGHIAGRLDERGDNALTVVSACAGQGHDLFAERARLRHESTFAAGATAPPARRSVKVGRRPC
jgi:hypothetical protein